MITLINVLWTELLGQCVSSRVFVDAFSSSVVSGVGGVGFLFYGDSRRLISAKVINRERVSFSKTELETTSAAAPVSFQEVWMKGDTSVTLQINVSAVHTHSPVCLHGDNMGGGRSAECDTPGGVNVNVFRFTSLHLTFSWPQQNTLRFTLSVNVELFCNWRLEDLGKLGLVGRLHSTLLSSSRSPPAAAAPATSPLFILAV